MAKFSLDTATELSSGGNHCSLKGKYHFSVSEVLTETKKGESIDGFACELDILAGTTPGQEGKTMLIYFNNPSGTSEEARRIAQQLQTAFFIAVGIIDKTKLGESAEVELTDAVSRQFVMEVEPKKEKDAEGNYTVTSDKFMRACYSNCYHVDDPDVAKVPKNADALEMIPAELRRPADYFDFKASHKKAAPAKPKQKWKDVEL